MGFGGWQSPWPLQWGGGQTPIESALEALRAGVGKGHASEVDGVEWRWREARAIGIAIGMTMAERALSQYDARYATSGLAFYRELYGLDGYEDQDVRDRANSLADDNEDFGESLIEQKLQEIDGRFSLLSRTWEQSDTTIHGRTFTDWNRDDSFNLPNDQEETLWPNYSNYMQFVVKLDVVGVPTDADLASVAKARAFLDDELPAWVDYEIGGDAGFVLDQSLLDWDRFD